MSTSTSTEFDISTTLNEKIEFPRKFKVIYCNDDYTTMQFVIETLIQIFGYNEEKAYEKCEEVHTSGSAVVAVLPHEVAEHKSLYVCKLARLNNYPLVVKVEQE